MAINILIKNYEPLDLVIVVVGQTTNLSLRYKILEMLDRSVLIGIGYSTTNLR